MKKLLSLIAAELSAPIPPASADGDTLFDLDDGLTLGVSPLPGREECAVWCAVAPAPVPASGVDAEERRAAEFLRLRLARVHGAKDIAATRGDDGALLVYRLLGDLPDADTVRHVADLVNEAATLREALGAGVSGAYGDGRTAVRGGFPVPNVKGLTWD